MSPEESTEVAGNEAAYQSPMTDVPMNGQEPGSDITIKKKKKKYGIVIAIGAVVLLLAACVVFFVLDAQEKQRQKEQKEEEAARAVQAAIDTHNGWVDKVELVASTIAESGDRAQQLNGLTERVWRNAINKNSDPSTNQYTIITSVYSPGITYYESYCFWSDFNFALLTLSEDADVMAKVEQVKKDQELVDGMMTDLKTLPQDFAKCYEVLSELYTSYKMLTDMAVAPKGSLNSFSENCDTQDNKFAEANNRLKTQIPPRQGGAQADASQLPAISSPDNGVQLSWQ